MQSPSSLRHGAEETRHVCCGSGLIGVSPFLSLDFRLCKTCTHQTSWKSSTSTFLILLLSSSALVDAGLYQLLLFTLKHHSDHEAPSTQWADRGSPILGCPHSKMLCLNVSFARWKYQDKPQQLTLIEGKLPGMNLISWPVAFSTHRRMTLSKSTCNKPEAWNWSWWACMAFTIWSAGKAETVKSQDTRRSFDFFSRSAANLWPSSAKAQWHDQDVNEVRPGILSMENTSQFWGCTMIPVATQGLLFDIDVEVSAIRDNLLFLFLAQKEFGRYVSGKESAWGFWVTQGASEVWMYDTILSSLCGVPMLIFTWKGVSHRITTYVGFLEQDVLSVT